MTLPWSTLAASCENSGEAKFDGSVDSRVFKQAQRGKVAASISAVNTILLIVMTEPN